MCVRQERGGWGGGGEKKRGQNKEGRSVSKLQKRENKLAERMSVDSERIKLRSKLEYLFCCEYQDLIIENKNNNQTTKKSGWNRRTALNNHAALSSMGFYSIKVDVCIEHHLF